MSLDINLKKGLKIPLKGKAEKKLVHAKSCNILKPFMNNNNQHIEKNTL